MGKTPRMRVQAKFSVPCPKLTEKNIKYADAPARVDFY